MKISSLYNTKVTLENTDFIAFDEKRHLLIKEGDCLYKSIKPIVGSLRRELTVNSVGYYSREEIFHEDWEWISYEEYNTNS
jgi:hypothetical protein